jgi:hypothetical protein
MTKATNYSLQYRKETILMSAEEVFAEYSRRRHHQAHYQEIGSEFGHDQLLFWFKGGALLKYF